MTLICLLFYSHTTHRRSLLIPYVLLSLLNFDQRNGFLNLI